MHRWQGYCRRRWPTSASKKQRQSTGPSSTRIHAPVVASVQSLKFATNTSLSKVTPSTLKYMAAVHRKSSSSWGNCSASLKRAFETHFIRSMNNSSFAWLPQVDHFSKLEQYSTLVFDNRGVGMSGSPRGPYSFVRGFLSVRDIDSPVGRVEWQRMSCASSTTFNGRRTVACMSLAYPWVG